jgi:hypothetical protein
MTLRAIYDRQAKALRLSEPLDIPDGGTVEIDVHPLNEDDLLRMALAGLVVFPDANAPADEPDMTEDELRRETARLDGGQNLGARAVSEEREDRR